MIHFESHWQRGFNDCMAGKLPNEPIKGNKPHYCPENNGYRNGYRWAERQRTHAEYEAHYSRATPKGDTPS